MAGALEGDIFIGPKAEVIPTPPPALSFLPTRGRFPLGQCQSAEQCCPYVALWVSHPRSVRLFLLGAASGLREGTYGIPLLEMSLC